MVFLLSKILPFLKRPRKQSGVTGDLDLPALGDTNKSDFSCKVLLLDDLEVVVHCKVFILIESMILILYCIEI